MAGTTRSIDSALHERSKDRVQEAAAAECAVAAPTFQAADGALWIAAHACVPATGLRVSIAQPHGCRGLAPVGIGILGNLRRTRLASRAPSRWRRLQRDPTAPLGLLGPRWSDATQ
ncbi:MAG: hypothetical protein RL685_6864 [Pseudomonadota bacterium]|jgi:hypothetical protein